MQRPANARAALAWRTGLTLRAIWFLTLRRRFGGIVRGLLWAGQFIDPRLKCRDLFMGRGKLREQRQNQPVLLAELSLVRSGGCDTRRLHSTRA
jgi:hypothetical protein